MSILIGGIPWVPQDAGTHAQDALVALNALQTAQGLPTLTPDPTNAVWLMLLGEGELAQTQDLAINAGFNSLDIANCDDSQVMHLLPIAGTTLRAATFSSMIVHIAATAGGSCIITAGMHVQFTNSAGVTFLIAQGATIPASGSADFLAVASVAGPVQCLTGQVTGLQEAPANLGAVTNAASAIVGKATETPAAARGRVIAGGAGPWGLNGALNNLLAVPGVTQAILYYNTNTSTDLVLPGGVHVAPRFCQIYIIGADLSGTAIASAFAAAMDTPTQGTQTQNYTFQNGQIFPVKYDFGTTQAVYVKVYYDSNFPTQAGFDTLIKTLVNAISMQIGQAASAEIILNALNNFTYASIVGASVSLDNITYDYKATVNGNAVASFPVINITVVAD